ncbi:MAG: acyltransferase family protein [Prevotella sp.]|nr:acyltransferase family protein [Prevotella sp.]
MSRDTTISICKGVAIILMVVAHAEAPGALCKFIFEFHMPLFFITAGFFFSLKYLNNEAEFIKKRIKGLYLPFVKWSVFFLIIHNWMFDIGILNEKFGNEMGGVTHPYTWHQMQQNLWHIISSMGGYDQFLCGAFWFFRGLFVASILYLITYKVTDAGLTKLSRWFGRIKMSDLTPYIVCLVLLFLCGWKTYEGLKIVTLVQGGYRDMMGCFFFGCGFIFRQYVSRYRTFMDRHYMSVLSTFLFALIVFMFSKHLTANMNWRSTYVQFLSLPIPAILGFLMTYNISRWLDRHEGWLKRFLVYTGDHTLNIFIFHIVAYKTVSLIKIWYYQLDTQQIGCHMVIHDYSQQDLFWILYTIAGVGIPLFFTKLSEIIREKIKASRASSGSLPL